MSSKHVILQCHQIDVIAWWSVKWAEAALMLYAWASFTLLLVQYPPQKQRPSLHLTAHDPHLWWLRWKRSQLCCQRYQLGHATAMTPERRCNLNRQLRTRLTVFTFRAHKHGGRAPLRCLTVGATPPPITDAGASKFAWANFLLAAPPNVEYCLLNLFKIS